MASLTWQFRSANPVAACVEDAGGVRMHNKRYLAEYYHSIPLRYRRMSGRPPDLLLQDVNSELHTDYTIDDIAQALSKNDKKRMSEDEYWQYLYDKHNDTKK